jgi:hypothetical protein
MLASYPDDEDLAESMQALGINVTKEQIKHLRKRFYGRPKLGDKIKEEKASPTKNVIRNKANQLNVREALAEILDNIFDNYERNLPKSLDVEISVYPKDEATPGEIFIVENSGGVEEERIIPLIQLGFSERSARGIGAWGEGFKMAVFALGEEVQVFSTFPSQEPIAIHFPRGWLDPKHFLWKEWKVDTYRIAENPPPEGTTIIRINHLRRGVLEDFGFDSDSVDEKESVCYELTRYFGEIYAEKYHNLINRGYGDISIKISIGSISREVEFSDRVKARYLKNLAFFPWLRPLHWKLTWETKIDELGVKGSDGFRTARLSAEIYAGLAATFEGFQGYEKDDTGVEMWGNGRLFSLKGRIDDESVGWGYKFGGRAGYNPRTTGSSRRMTIAVLFTADDSRDVPWSAPVKNDYNRRSEFYAEIQDALARVIKIYKDALPLLDSRFLPFSYAWTQLDKETKLEELFKVSDATPEFKTQFAQSRFGRKVLTYKPELSFVEISGADYKPTVRNLYGISRTLIKNTVVAARETKESAEQVVGLLKALFPNLYRQAQIEDRLGLLPNEELE